MTFAGAAASAAIDTSDEVGPGAGGTGVWGREDASDARWGAAGRRGARRRRRVDHAPPAGAPRRPTAPPPRRPAAPPPRRPAAPPPRRPAAPRAR
jgi:hypothetical protein